MMKLLLEIVLVLAALFSQCAGAAPGDATRPASPRRVISLDLCTDEMLAYYGARVPALKSKIAALSPLSRQTRAGQGSGVDFTGWPAHDGSLEQVLQYRPNLVLSGPYNALLLRQRLAQLGAQSGTQSGVRVEVLPLPQRLDDIVPYEQRLLALLGLPAALADVPVPSAVSMTSHAPRLLLLGANGIGTGTGTLEGDILARAGWRNYVQAPGYVSLDLERIATDPPDAVLWVAPVSPALANRFAEHPVMKHAVPASHWLVSQAWRWQCPGPWSWDLVRELTNARERLAR